MLRLAPLLRPLIVVLLCAPALAVNARPAAPQDSQGPATLVWAARLGETTVSFEELDRLLLGRHALSKEGRATMLYLLKLRVIEFLAREGGVAAAPAEIQALMEEVESGVVAAGKAASLADYLRREGIEAAEFEESIRLSVLQRELTRRALGIPVGEPVSGEQQEVWLESRISGLGLEEFDAPWDGGLVLRCADVTLGRDEFLAYLRTRLDPANVREALVDLLRVKRMRARMPDLSAEAFARSIEEEIQGRRNEVTSDPQYQGIPYEQLLESQGILFATWPEDPALQQAALARTWVERKYDEEALRRVYEDERELFDSRYGEAIEAWVIFLRAAEVKNELIRDFGEAESILSQAREATRSKAEFLQRIQLLSEDKASRENEGLLGWITRPTSESPTREAIFEALDSGAFQPGAAENSLSRLVGPVRTQTGVLLLWLGRRRPAPAWPTMVVYVARELRHRFVDDSLDPRQVQTFLDPK